MVQLKEVVLGDTTTKQGKRKDWYKTGHIQLRIKHIRMDMLNSIFLHGLIFHMP